VYDYSGLEKGMRLQAESDGAYYAAEVVQVSRARNRVQAPVKVSYTGYEGYDEWVGGDRLRSKALKVKAPETRAEEEKPEKPKEKLQLNYWPLFGKNVAAQLALEFGGFDWEMGPAPGDKGTGNLWEEWLEMKPDTTWGFLPNLKAGNKLVGSELSILQFLARRRRSLAGGTEGDWLVSQELLHQAEELYQKYSEKVPTIMAKDKDKAAFEAFMEGGDKTSHSNAQGLQVYLGQFEEFFSKQGREDAKFTRLGQTIGELKLFATLEMIVKVKAGVLEGYPNLLAFTQRLRETPQVKGVLEGTAKNMKGPGTQYFIAPP